VLRLAGCAVIAGIVVMVVIVVLQSAFGRQSDAVGATAADSGCARCVGLPSFSSVQSRA
jgi:hypothetical protein